MLRTGSRPSVGVMTITVLPQWALSSSSSRVRPCWAGWFTNARL